MYIIPSACQFTHSILHQPLVLEPAIDLHFTLTFQDTGIGPAHVICQLLFLKPPGSFEIGPFPVPEVALPSPRRDPGLLPDAESS
ncbi:hypothetical protein HPP92_028784 [Vanilla planifolia]|uniref:Uncharacterized protein n=1 Tax=Vanilla planifolia TaxID=51239 RepID=A0A835U2L6_VANPL|nr:hypothetical protein HPP92_028784 [Vanilla planifolia]KAG0446573.1 hypothetical protein HPP92_028773 [Vanilla planifolia]